MRKTDGRMIGVLDVRHELTTDFLREYGGNIGYAVRPSERKKGYASQMLRLALKYCQSLSIKSARLGCYADNIASIRTIEKCGGIQVEQKRYTNGKPMLVYEVPCK